MKKFLGILLLISACCKPGEQEIVREAQIHAQKLRSHFMGYRSEDVSTLIAETKEISYQLKLLKLNRLANKFDSYTDVLMYGNNTLDESVKDMLELVNKGIYPCEFETCMPNQLDALRK